MNFGKVIMLRETTEQSNKIIRLPSLFSGQHFQNMHNGNGQRRRLSSASDLGVRNPIRPRAYETGSGFVDISLNKMEYPTMDMKLRLRVWRDISNILLSDVKGGGLNAYRTTSIRLALTLARRLGWVQHKTVSHFEMVLWQRATEAIENGLWGGRKRDAMRYYFWRFISTEASRMALNLGIEDAKELHKLDKVA
jgi:hypothetical protein